MYRLLIITLALLASTSALADEAKLMHSCGCKIGSYAVYGAGEESCSTFTKEFAANPSIKDIDASYGQSLGWIAGYLSATNRALRKRDLLDSDLDYVAYQVNEWCQKNPDKTLSDAMDMLTDAKLK